MKRVIALVALTAVWVLLWGQLSVANALSGVVVTAFLLAAYPTRIRGGNGFHLTLRPLPFVRFVFFAVGYVLASNVVMARIILSPRQMTRTGIVGCPLQSRTDGMITLITNLLALSPGIMPVEVVMPDDESESPTVYVHVLRLRDRDEVCHQVRRLEELALSAFVHTSHSKGRT